VFGALGDVACAGIAEHVRQGFAGIDLEDHLHLGTALRVVGEFHSLHLRRLA